MGSVLKQNKCYNVLGVMSGTSLDGLDLALCKFEYISESWSFSVRKGTTIKYSDKWKDSLSKAQGLSSYEFIQLHRQYGDFIGERINLFLDKTDSVDFVASHGHTVFHEPHNQVTFQIGCGAQIAAKCGLKVVSDFRTLDIALGGQGAPLVPIGDEVLFKEYDACINLGGFANISFNNKKEERIAFDICPVNIVLNELVFKISGKEFDFDGEYGKKGNLIASLLEELNQIDFYQINGPKSLAREWVELEFNPIIDKYSNSRVQDILTTCYHHFAYQIKKVINRIDAVNVLCTGGGTFNSFLMDLIREKQEAKIAIPSKEIIDYKEALVFAFLGVLRVEEENNCLSSVTGSVKDNCGGSVYLA